MRGYGLPRDKGVEFPDVGDIQEFGRKSSVGRLAGDEHGYIRHSNRKRAIRRIWKRRARLEIKKAIQEELNNG